MPQKTEVKDLTQRQLDCYRYRHEEKMTHVAIGETLGISEGMVRQHLKIAEKISIIRLYQRLIWLARPTESNATVPNFKKH